MNPDPLCSKTNSVYAIIASDLCFTVKIPFPSWSCWVIQEIIFWILLYIHGHIYIYTYIRTWKFSVEKKQAIHTQRTDCDFAPTHMFPIDSQSCPNAQVWSPITDHLHVRFAGHKVPRGFLFISWICCLLKCQRKNYVIYLLYHVLGLPWQKDSVLSTMWTTTGATPFNSLDLQYQQELWTSQTTSIFHTCIDILISH